MAEILALGLSHYPALIGEDERMSGIFQRMLQNPELPVRLRDPANWPADMRAEWGDDKGAAAALRHRAKMVDWMRKVRAALDDFNPDFVLLWGDDQYENFREDIVPPYCLSAYDRFEFGVPPGNIWGDDENKRYALSGVPSIAKKLAGELIEAGFDMSYAYKPLHHDLGHAFTNAVLYLDYDRKGFSYPILPISVNCYGRRVICQRGGIPRFDSMPGPEDLDPPAPSPWRLFDMGAATARILAESPWRVAVIASSGWSHAFLTEKNHFLYPDTPADRRLYDALRAGNYELWRGYPAKAIEESGQQEVLNWMCLAGALRALDRTAPETGFVDTWIFNSSKVFLISRPGDR